MDRQCSSCGGFCRKSGCERENVKPEPEPVAWADKYDIEREGHDFYVNRQQPAKDGAPLYTAPPHFLDPSKVARLLDEAFERGKKEAVSEQAEKQEPVAWMHNFIAENVIAHRPADIDRYPDRWTALYKDPTPCQTCESLLKEKNNGR